MWCGYGYCLVYGWICPSFCLQQVCSDGLLLLLTPTNKAIKIPHKLQPTWLVFQYITEVHEYSCFKTTRPFQFTVTTLIRTTIAHHLKSKQESGLICFGSIYLEKASSSCNPMPTMQTCAWASCSWGDAHSYCDHNQPVDYKYTMLLRRLQKYCKYFPSERKYQLNTRNTNKREII